MEVEVVAGQVGEPADREVHGVDAAQRQRVAGHLHHDRVDAALDHHREQRLQIGRLGRGQRARLVAPVDADADGADQPGDPARRAQPGLDQIGRRGLAGRAGHADDAQPLRRAGRRPWRPPRRAPTAGAGWTSTGTPTSAADRARRPPRR